MIGLCNAGIILIARRRGSLSLFDDMSRDFKIIVIGGGLGGLTFALACFRYGITVDVYEQAPRFGTVGAGVEIGPNAVKVLNKLDLEKEFEAISSPFSERYMVRLLDY